MLPLADIANLVANSSTNGCVAYVAVAIFTDLIDASRLSHVGDPAWGHIDDDVVQFVNVVWRVFVGAKLHRPDPKHLVSNSSSVPMSVLVSTARPPCCKCDAEVGHSNDRGRQIAG